MRILMGIILKTIAKNGGEVNNTSKQFREAIDELFNASSEDLRRSYSKDPYIGIDIYNKID